MLKKQIIKKNKWRKSGDVFKRGFLGSKQQLEHSSGHAHINLHTGQLAVPVHQWPRCPLCALCAAAWHCRHPGQSTPLHPPGGGALRGTCALLAGAIYQWTPWPRSTSQAGVRCRGGSKGRRGKGARPLTPLGFTSGIPAGEIPVSAADLRTWVLSDLPGQGESGAFVPEAPRAGRSQVHWGPTSLFLAREHSSVPQNSKPSFTTCLRHLHLLLSFTNFLFWTQ